MPRVLYIDDDEGLRLLTQRALRRRGYEVVTAASGDEGLARLIDEFFDLVAIDHYMPGKDGLETLAMFSTLPEMPPVVYVTGSEESRVAVAALKAGAADYVVKTVGEGFFDLLSTSFAQALERTRLVAAKAEAEAALKATNERLEVLLDEANHRVANSLQIVSAFVQMQAAALDSESARLALKETQQRIRAIGQVHRRLYTSGDIETVDMADYLQTLVRELEETWSTPASQRSIHFLSDPIRLSTDRAVSVGVVVNELVSNACKYAYAEGSMGTIRVFLRQEDDEFLLAVEDDGPGLPDAAASPQGTGIGTKIIRAMAHSLKARIDYAAGPGVRVTLRAAL
ncbi:sensor histidine kinase [Mangrovicella endophytica]|uniref:sensor histidine kinase n=1 Tax=Mangrovicella endophytica TaxID=2066697 RepID=UPI000C9E936F|nr:histidine kinase dimerization/phosphoacceptor domain -containing protein [Mangrovicella endophytica]